MFTMKRTLAFTAVLLLSSVTAFAQSDPQNRADGRSRFRNRLLDDVVEMTRAQLPDATIVAYVRSRKSRLDADVTANDLIRLHRAGVSDRVVQFIASAAGIDDRGWDGRQLRDRDRYSDDDRDRDRYRDGDRNRDTDGDRDGVVAWDGPDDNGDGDGGVVAYPPYGGVYDGWYGYPYWWGFSPFFGTDVFIGRGFHRFRGGHDGGGMHSRTGSGAVTRGGGSRGGSHSSGSHSGGSHGGGSHGGGSHGGGGHH